MTKRVDRGDGAVLPWRIVAGAFVHFVVPAYLLAIPAACLFTAPADATLAQLVAPALPYSGWFLAGYAALGTAATLGAGAIDPLLRRRRRNRNARDPRIAVASSEERLRQASADGRRLLDARAVRHLDRIRDTRWDHGDQRYQALSVDLAEIVRTSAAALTTAAPERRAALLDMAGVSLGRIETALAALTAARGRLDEGDAATVARYVELRYASSDFAGDDS